MTNPIISLYASAARPEKWMKLYDSIKHNNNEFEIVFVGPKTPRMQLPRQFNYIKSYTKPAQCAEIAARNAKGMFLLHCVDDLIFTDKNALDKIIEYYKNSKKEGSELILTPKLMRNGEPYLESNYKLYPEINDCPYIPISIFIKTSLYRDLGGYDLTFIASMADTDLAYRGINEANASIEFVEVFVDENKNDAGGGTLFADYMHNDLTLLKELWFKDKRFLHQRSKIFSGFSKSNINTITQGRKGRWGVIGIYLDKIGILKIYIPLKNIVKRFFKFIKNTVIL